MHQPIKQQPGFTLLELMVTVAIVGILVAMAAPSFRSLIVQNRLESGLDRFANAINLARSEAVKRNGLAGIVPVDSADWSQGWQVMVDGNRDGDLADAGVDIVLQDAEPLSPNIQTVEGAGYQLTNNALLFNASGTVFETGDRLTLVFSDVGCKYHKSITLGVNTFGRMVLTEAVCSL